MKNRVKTFTAQISIGLRAGYSERVHSLEEVREICQQYVNEVGLCVTVTPTEFIYTNGNELGAIVGFINYPRFPSGAKEIEKHASELAERLKGAMGQNRVSIIYPQHTVMLE